MIHLFPPGWDSLEVVSKLARRFTIWGLICLAGVVVFDVLAYFYQQRKDELQAALGAPRRLTEDQKIKLAAVLSAYSGNSAVVDTLLGNTECMVYGQDFMDVFARAKWHAEFSAFVTWDIAFSGLAIATQKGQPVPAPAIALEDEMRVIGIPFSVQVAEKMPDNSVVQVWVNERRSLL